MRNVLISGASVAGPALAFWLRRYGFAPTIVERAPQLRPGGYKVDLRGVAVEVARRMGILDEVRARSTDIRGGQWLNRKGKAIATLGPDLIGFRDPGDLEIMRGDLAQLLYETTQDVEYVFGDSITAMEEGPNGIRVSFENGTPRTFDLVVGADGLHSGVRALTFGPESRFSHGMGLNVAVFTVPNHLGLDRWELALSDAGHVANLYSVRKAADAKALFFFPAPGEGVDRRDVRAQQQTVREAFAKYGWEVPRLLAEMEGSPDFYYDSLAQLTMPAWSVGRTALVGDAAYCPSPASGQGTGLALVGAYVLAGELAAAGGPGGGDHQAAFAAYEREMRAYVDLNQKLGRDVVKQLVPATPARARLQSLMMRSLRFMPGKGMVLEKIMQPIREAANGIELKTYAAPETYSDSARRSATA
ncbi:FAD-dependent monooxygenase [Actinomadura barringtoniae]|uniref:FAD-dependent monooxygenase n=1 Tax=Actinomadura barringtoniae TaxID=1427535 RepID=A0A939PM75_9ACTN|nr:FAD-dependent monooxygenase [Actinomadura barringtoniae]MBO2452613.1 FAD-dependent monooxygenase [Actinomadura barringtoniae]